MCVSVIKKKERVRVCELEKESELVCMCVSVIERKSRVRVCEREKE